MSTHEILIQAPGHAEAEFMADRITTSQIATADHVHVRVTAPDTLYSVVTDYGTDAEGVTAEHYASAEERFHALRERVANLTDQNIRTLDEEALRAFLEDYFRPTGGRVLLTESSRQVSG